MFFIPAVRSFTLKQPDDLPGRDPGGRLGSIGILLDAQLCLWFMATFSV